MRQDIGGKKAEEIVVDSSVPADKLICHAVSRVVGDVKNQGAELIEALH
jgi:putative SOS response-associated peptidase YedK